MRGPWHWSGAAEYPQRDSNPWCCLERAERAGREVTPGGAGPRGNSPAISPGETRPSEPERYSHPAESKSSSPLRKSPVARARAGDCAARAVSPPPRLAPPPSQGVSGVQLQRPFWQEQEPPESVHEGHPVL